MSLSALLCRSPIKPLDVSALMDRFITRRNFTSSQMSILSNGVRVVTAPGPLPYTHLSLCAEAGSRYEDRGNGVTTGTAHATSRVLAANFAGTPWAVSTTTDREYSRLSLSLPKGDLKKAISAIGEVANGPRVNDADLRAVLHHMRNEIADLRTNPWAISRENTVNNLFEMSPLGQPVLPMDQDDVGAITDRSIKTHANEWISGAPVLVAIGDVDHDAVVEYASKALSWRWESKRKMKQPMFLAGIHKEFNKSMPLVYTQLSYEAPPATSEDALAFPLVRELLGEFSRRNGEYGAETWVAREIAFCYWVRDMFTNYYGFSDAGFFSMNVSGTASTFKDLFQKLPILSLQYDANRMSYQLTAEELHNAKARWLLTAGNASASSPDAHAAEIGNSVLMHGRHIGLVERARRVVSMDHTRLRDIMQKYFYMGNVFLEVIGAGNDCPDHAILKMGTWLWRG